MMPTDLIAWQKRYGLTRAAAAKVLGVGFTTFRHWLKGRHPISLTAEKLCIYIDKHGLPDGD